MNEVLFHNYLEIKETFLHLCEEKKSRVLSSSIIYSRKDVVYHVKFIVLVIDFRKQSFSNKFHNSKFITSTKIYYRNTY